MKQSFDGLTEKEREAIKNLGLKAQDEFDKVNIQMEKLGLTYDHLIKRVNDFWRFRMN
jgi:hypothetical protein